MRPIKLKIKGLNSFIEEQTIDFEKLTQQGLFGIFGPTGSGKTTILDGITLALYGEVSRKSNTFINANCDSCHVTFEFMIHGKVEKRYRVTRKFKRDKASGNSRSDSALLIDLTDGNEEILQDKITLVSKACEEVIGLGIEDFTRTVVLPQGKFSEFLKLEGKARRDMLERLFNLQRYGDELSNNMSKKVSQVKMENSVLLGELKGYENISEEQCKLQEEQLKETKANYQVEFIQQQALLAKMKQAEIIIKQQAELKKVQADMAELMKRETEIKGQQVLIQKAEAAKRILPTMLFYEQLQQELAKNQENMGLLTIRFRSLKTSKEILLQEEKQVNQIRTVEYPTTLNKCSQLEDALAEEVLIYQLKNDVQGLMDKKANNEQLKQQQETLLHNNQNELKALAERIATNETASEKVQIDDRERANVQAGWMISENITKNLKIEADLKLKQKRYIEEKQNDERALVSLEIKIPQLNQKITEYQEKAKTLQQQIPDGEELIKRNLSVQEGHDVVTKRNQLDLTIEKLKTDNLTMLQYQQKLDDELKQIEEKIVRHNQMLEHQKIEQLASQLRQDLIENQPCPVCGSIHHEIIYEDVLSVNVEQTNQLGEALNQSKTELLKSVQQHTSKLFANEALLKTKTEELQALPLIDSTALQLQETELKALMSLKMLNEKSLKETELSLQEIQKEVNQCLILQGQKQTNLMNSVKNLAMSDKEQIENQSEMKQYQLQLNERISVFGITDFKARNEEIKKMDATLKSLLGTLKKDREVVKKKQGILETQQKTYQETLNQLILDENTLTYKIELINTKQQAILAKFPQLESVKSEIEKVKKQLLQWQQLFKDHQVKMEQVEQDYTATNDALLVSSTNVQQLTTRVLVESQKLEEQLRKEGLISMSEVKENDLDEDLLNKKKAEVESHFEQVTKLEALYQHLIKELNGQQVSEEAWQSDCEQQQKNETMITSLNEKLIKQEQAITILKERLIEMGDLMIKKQAVEHKIALLNDLEKLFKGKKFVEFAALSQLRYVSHGADQRLKSITNGNYGIEIDENGRFIIRDYKNGGVAREPATLSGGETFLASLSLALSLSAQIQLKGSAPLELFFLDEGFGTLDEHYLDIVMDSLEKIHNEHLKIGLITHVESIKNRMPMKLMIEPAVAGEGGSKVHIERL